MLAVLIYYAALSIPLAFGMAPIFAAMVSSIERLASTGASILLGACAALFVIAWIGQFIGQAIEGKRPSFFKDIQCLLIGPLWLLADLYRRLGVRFRPHECLIMGPLTRTGRKETPACPPMA
jgi:uncharacterized membrane protein YGL010W